MKKTTLILALFALVGFASACADKKDDDDSLLLAGLLLTGSSGPTVGTWAAPVAGSTTKGSCITSSGGTSLCTTNYTEGACSLLITTYGFNAIFSTSTGATSVDTTDNLCVSNGYTSCTSQGTYLQCSK